MSDHVGSADSADSGIDDPPRPSVLRAPFTLQTWRCTAYAVLALPLTVMTVLLSTIGRERTALVLQARASRALLGVDLPTGRPARAQLLGYGLLALPLNAVVLVVTVYLWAAAIANIAYPLRPDSGDLANAWGGPTLAGAWAVHAVGGLLLLLATPWIVRGVTRLQAASVRRMATNRKLRQL